MPTTRRSYLAAVGAVSRLMHAGRERFLKRVEARRARTA